MDCFAVISINRLFSSDLMDFVSPLVTIWVDWTLNTQSVVIHRTRTKAKFQEK